MASFRVAWLPPHLGRLLLVDAGSQPLVGWKSMGVTRTPSDGATEGHSSDAHGLVASAVPASILTRRSVLLGWSALGAQSANERSGQPNWLALWYAAGLLPWSSKYSFPGSPQAQHSSQPSPAISSPVAAANRRVNAGTVGTVRMALGERPSNVEVEMESKPNRRLPTGTRVGIGIAIGVGFGLIFAPLFNWNIGVAIAIGAGFGLIFGGALDIQARGK
jgi:hypothetical protein